MSLAKTKHFVVDCDYPRRLVVARRTPEAFDSMRELASTFATIHAALDTLARPRFALLVDTRVGPVRNDPEFEEAFEPHRRRMFAGFARAAILVRTATGRLQVQRHLRGDGSTTGIFDDEEQALLYLRAPAAEPPTR